MATKSLLASHTYEALLTYEQQQRYASAIRQGFFATYRGNEWRHTFYGAWIWKHPNRVKIISRFRDMIGHPPDWADITDDNLRDFFGILSDSYSPNSVRTICAEMKALIRANSKSHKVPALDFSSILKRKSEVSQAVYLTDEEIMKVHAYTPRTLVARHVKRMFMLECLTGARMSDCECLSTDNINNGGRTLTYVAQKTKTEVTVPVHTLVPQYLVRLSPSEPKTVTVATYSYCIRDICEHCGINASVQLYAAGQRQSGPKYQFVSSHTGRRSFATNLARKGVALEQISLLMGHMRGNTPNILMTQRYIIGKMRIDASVFKLFDVNPNVIPLEETTQPSTSR